MDIRLSFGQVGLAVVLSLIFVTTTFGQNLTAARIEGVVADESGAPMPGVTIIATSPSLQVAARNAVSDAKGEYRFLELPTGVYSIQFELQGFQTAIRSDVTLTAGFAARINIVMKIGGVSERVTVSGESLIVDVSTTRGGQTLHTEQLLTVLPGNKTMADAISMSPGLVNTAGQNPGSLGLDGRPRFETYGLGSNNTNTTMMLDGVQLISNNPLPDLGTTYEIDVRTFGNGAEIREPGAAINLVMKSGGDDFHGQLSEAFLKQPFTNIDDAQRARRYTVASRLRYFNDASADLGGRLIRKKLWFYGAFRQRINQQTYPGLVADAGPDKTYLTGDEPAASPKLTGQNASLKLSYQMTPTYVLSGLFVRDKTTSESQSNNYAFTPFDSTNTFDWIPLTAKAELKGTPSSKVFLDLSFGRSGGWAHYGVQQNAVNAPTSRDNFTGLNSGSADPRDAATIFYTFSSQATVVPSNFLGGDHEFKLGYYFGRRNGYDYRKPKAYGAYSLTFDNGAPFQAVFTNAPTETLSVEDTSAVFVSDRWRIKRRLTLNLGLRMDRQVSFVPAQARAAGQWPFAPAAAFPKLTVLKYQHLAPRAALAFDVDGRGRTVIKATYGWFNPESGLASGFNQNFAYSNTYLWRDLNGNRNYDAGEVDLSLTGADFVSTTSPTFNILNPDLKLSNVQEITAALEHQLSAASSIRTLYLRRITGGRSATVNLRRPYEVYDIPITRRDPGPDGVLGTADDGGMVTFYDYAATYRPATFVQNQTLNAPSSVPDDWSQSFEAAFTKRQGRVWSTTASITLNNAHGYTWATTPNQSGRLLFPTLNTWRWNSKLNGDFNLPGGVSVGGILEFLSGPQGARTVIFRATDASGPPLRGLSTVTVQVEPDGARKEPHYALVNARVSKVFRLGAARDVRLSFDVLNLFNSNAVLGVSYASGPNFLNVTDSVPPRDLRIGVAYTF